MTVAQAQAFVNSLTVNSSWPCPLRYDSASKLDYLLFQHLVTLHLQSICREQTFSKKKILQKNDHLVISIEQHRKAGAYVTIYFSCVPKGRFTMPYSLREMVEKNSKVKLYHGEDLEIQVTSKE